MPTATQWFYRSKAEAVMRVSDVNRIASSIQSSRYMSYLVMLIAVFIIYTIPVVQLVINDIAEFNTGNQVWV